MINILTHNHNAEMQRPLSPESALAQRYAGDRIRSFADSANGDVRRLIPDMQRNAVHFADHEHKAAEQKDSTKAEAEKAAPTVEPTKAADGHEQSRGETTHPAPVAPVPETSTTPDVVTIAPSDASLHPAAANGAMKTATGATLLAATGLAAYAGTGVAIPTALETNYLAGGIWAGFNAIGAPVVAQTTAALSTIGIPAAASVAPWVASVPLALGGIAGLYAVGKLSNATMRGAYAFFGYKHPDTGWGTRNLWYGAKAITSPVWGPLKGAWWLRGKAGEGLQWGWERTKDVGRWAAKNKKPILGGAVLGGALALGTTLAPYITIPAGLLSGAAVAKFAPEKPGSNGGGPSEPDKH